MKTVFITGASGFLGSNLLEVLSKHGDFRLIASTNNKEKIMALSCADTIRIVPRDYIDSDAFAAEEIDCVINCAYPRNSTGFDIAGGLQYLERAFSKFRNANIKSVINISSQSVYDGQRTAAADETAALCLNDAYSIGKFFTERMLEVYCGDIPHTNLRMASLIGAGFNQRIVNRFVAKALNMEQISVIRSGQRFGFLDVRDAAAAVLAVLSTNPSEWKPIYNTGGSMSFTLNDLMREIQDVFRQEKLPFPEVIYTEGEQTSSTVLNCQLLTEDTGFMPAYSMQESVRAILNWYLAEQRASVT